MRVVPRTSNMSRKSAAKSSCTGTTVIVRIVGEASALVHPVLLEEARALDMHDALRRSRPSGAARGRLVRLAVNRILSCDSEAPSSDGILLPTKRRNRDSTRVSSRNSPSPVPLMSP